MRRHKTETSKGSAIIFIGVLTLIAFIDPVWVNPDVSSTGRQSHAHRGVRNRLPRDGWSGTRIEETESQFANLVGGFKQIPRSYSQI